MCRSSLYNTVAFPGSLMTCFTWILILHSLPDGVPLGTFSPSLFKQEKPCFLLQAARSLGIACFFFPLSPLPAPSVSFVWCFWTMGIFALTTQWFLCWVFSPPTCFLPWISNTHTHLTLATYVDASILPINGSRAGLVSFVFFTASQSNSEVFSAGKKYLQSVIANQQNRAVLSF